MESKQPTGMELWRKVWFGPKDTYKRIVRAVNEPLGKSNLPKLVLYTALASTLGGCATNVKTAKLPEQRTTLELKTMDNLDYLNVRTRKGHVVIETDYKSHLGEVFEVKRTITNKGDGKPEALKQYQEKFNNLVDIIKRKYK